jgi:hypothetical protein
VHTARIDAMIGDRKGQTATMLHEHHTCGINFLSHLRGAPQNLRQSGITWDEVGYMGRGEGGEIAVIAVIARHRRDRKGKGTPRRRGEQPRSGGIPGIELRKFFRILIEGGGGGVVHGVQTGHIPDRTGPGG